MWYNIIQQTSGDCKEVLPGSAVDFDVALSNVVFMFTQRQVAVFFSFEPYKSLTVTSTLLTETQCYSTPDTNTIQYSVQYNYTRNERLDYFL